MIVTPQRRAEHHEEIRGSRFLAVAAPLADPADAEALLAELRAEYDGASHHVSAWRFGRVERFDDDGEPGGTAGRPVLEVLQRRDLDRVAVVVVRWFGGTKLGAGGLVRAYGGAAARALDVAGSRTVHPRTELTVAVAFADLDAALRTVDGAAGARRSAPDFGAGGARFRVSVRARDLAALETALADATRGGARVHASGAGDAGTMET